MSTISEIAALLHLPVIETVDDAKRLLKAGGYLVDEENVKAAVLRIRETFDKERDELRAERDAALAALDEARELLPPVMVDHDAFGGPCRCDWCDRARALLTRGGQ